MGKVWSAELGALENLSSREDTAKLVCVKL